MFRFFILIFSLLFVNNSVLANVAIPDTMKQALKNTPDTPSVVNIVASLLVVILLIYVVSWIYIRLSHVNAKTIFKPQKDAEINKPKIISGITLGQNRNLHVVELNNKYLVLGVTPNNISLIKEFDKSEVSDKSKLIAKSIEQAEQKREEREVDKLFGNDIEKRPIDDELDNICKKYL